ncbi:MAG: GntR family transcriptional regulator [Chloroflexota bacterium]
MSQKQFPSQRLYEDLKQMINEAKPGQKLPAEPELAKQLGVARATLREALRIFEARGLLYRRQGAGTIIIHPHVIDTGLEVLESIETLAERSGLHVTMGDLKAAVITPSSEECEALGLDPATKVTRVARVIRAEGRPVAYLVDILPEDILTPDDLKEGFTGSVLDLLLRRGTPSLSNSRTELNAITAMAEEAKALGIQRGDVLLRFIAHLYETGGRVVDYSFSYFLPGYFKFHIVRKVGSI